MPFSRGSSQPRDRTGISYEADSSSTTWEAPKDGMISLGLLVGGEQREKKGFSWLEIKPGPRL